MKQLLVIVISCFIVTFGFAQQSGESKKSFIVNNAFSLKSNLILQDIASCKNGDFVVLYQGSLKPFVYKNSIKVNYKYNNPEVNNPHYKTYQKFNDNDISHDKLGNGLILRYDKKGKYLWGKYIGRIDNLNQHDPPQIKQISNGGFFIYGGGFIICTDSVGNIAWNFYPRNDSIPGIDKSVFDGIMTGLDITDITECKDGSFVALSQTSFSIIKFTKTGNPLWIKSLLFDKPLTYLSYTFLGETVSEGGLGRFVSVGGSQIGQRGHIKKSIIDSLLKTDFFNIRNIDNNDYVTDSTWCWVRSRGVELRSFNVVETEDKGFLALCYNHHHIHCNDYYQKVDSGYFSHYYTHTFANLDSSENPNRHYIDKFVFLPPEETWFPYPIFNKKNYPYHDIIKERAAMNNFTYNVYNNNTTDNIDCPKGNYVLVKTDSLGNVLWKRGFGNYSYCYENQSYGNIIKLANDKYLVFIRNFNEFGPFSCFYILNNKGETKRQLNTKIPYLNIELAADSGYYLGLNIDNTKFDKDLNVVWKSASLNWIGGSTFACTIDTGLILSSRACFQYNIFKIDKHGNDFPKNFSINTKEIKHGIRFTINYDNSFCNSYLEIKRVGGKKLPDKVLQYDYENSFYRRYPKKKPKSELIEKDIEVGIGGVIDLNCPDQLTTLYINHPKGYPIKGSLRFEPCVKDVTFYKIGYGMPIYPFKNIEIHCMTPGKYKYSYYYSYYNNKTKKYKKEVITGKFIIK